MVFWFESKPPGYEGEPVKLYMGAEKHENEHLIKFGFPGQDVWFHVDGLSSAHVYLRLPAGMAISALPASILKDCAHLVKHNSIEGCKQNNVRIVYTMWDNLRKTADMVTGQIGFHKRSALLYTVVEKKDNAITNRLNRTKTELATSSIREAREAKETADLAVEKKRKKAAAATEKKQQAERRETDELRRYGGENNAFHDEELMTSNTAFAGMSVEEAEDDFM
jgi:hypothetical protein